MCLVWVRSVLTDTNSSRAICGPGRGRRQQPQHVELSFAEPVGRGTAVDTAGLPVCRVPEPVDEADGCGRPLRRP